MREVPFYRTENPSVDLHVTEQELNGEMAQTFAKKVFLRHIHQRYPWFTNIQQPIPDYYQEITEVNISTIPQSGIYEFKQWRSKENGGERVIPIPVVYTDRIYQMADREKRTSLLVDHTNGLEPTPEFYQCLAENHLDAEEILSQIIFRMGFASDDEELEGFIRQHAEAAQLQNVPFDENKIIEHLRKTAHSGYGAPMHIYLAAFGGAETDPEMHKKVIEAARNSIDHAYIPYSEELETFFVQTQLSSPTGILATSLYDNLPFATRQFASAEHMKFDLARSAINRFQHQSQDADLSLAEISPEDTATLMTQAVVAPGWRIHYWNVLLMKQDDHPFEYHVKKGLLAYHKQLGLAKAVDVERILPYTAPGMGLDQDEDLRLSLRVAEKIVTPKTGRSVITRAAEEWLDLRETQERVEEIIGIQDRNDASRPSELLGTASGIHTPRITEQLTIPVMEVTQFNHKENSQDRRSTVLAPLWSLFDYSYSPGMHMKHSDFIAFIERTRTMFQTDFWKRQIPQKEQAQVFAFLDWLSNGATEYMRQSKYDWDVHYFTDHVKRICESDDQVVPYKNIIATMKKWAEAVWLTAQTEKIYLYDEANRQIHTYPQEKNPKATAIHTSDTFRPFQLITELPSTAIKITDTLSVDYEKERAWSANAHMGLRLHHLKGHLREQLRYQDYTGTHYTRSEELFLSEQTKELFGKWLKKHKKALPKITNRDHAFLRDPHAFEAWGKSYMLWTIQKMRTAMNQFHRFKTREGRRNALERARTYAAAMLEIYGMNGTFEHEDNPDRLTERFLDLGKEFNDLQEIFDRTVVAPGELDIQPGSAVFLLGQNMAGKSTVLRAIGHSVLLKRQGLAQPGGIMMPYNLVVDAPVGFEYQTGDDSLLGNMIPGLNRIAGTPGKSTVWLLDELGRRTNKWYGESLAITSTIMGLRNQRAGNYMVLSSHYHDLPYLAPLLSELGLNPTFYIMGDDHTVRPYIGGEKLRSNAFEAVRKHLPGPWLARYPGQNPNTLPRKNLRESGILLTPEEIARITIEDLFGKKGDQKYRSYAILPETDNSMWEGFFELFQDSEKGAHMQQFIEEIRNTTFERRSAAIHKVNTLLYPFSTGSTGYHFFESVFNNRKHVFKIPHDTPDKKARRLIINRMKKLSTEYGSVLDTLENVLRSHQGIDIDVSKLRKSFDTGDLLSMETKDFDAFRRELNKLEALSIYLGTIRRSGYTKAELLPGADLTIQDVWNPLMSKPKSEQITNDVRVSFDGTSRGMFISGENFAGKSNYLRAIAINAWLALHTGYAPARAITIDPHLVLLSLTQPVQDTQRKSSMEKEVENRFAPAVRVTSLYPDRPVLTLLDEPGAPTSPEDAAEAIHWLYRIYNENGGSSQLLVTSHVEQVPSQLATEHIPVDLVAFKLLTETPFKAFKGMTDSNALEVAKKLGLNPTFYRTAKIVYTYIKAVSKGADPAEIAPAFASEIRNQLR